MKIKWGALVVDGRGKIGGHVAARNRSGAYMRTKVTPNNPQTGFQTEARGRLATLSSSWRELTQSQRDAWNAAVVDFEKTNVFGDLVKPTGKNLFTGLNINLLLIELPIMNVPPLPADTISFENPDLTASIATGPSLDGTADSGMTYKVEATPSLSPGIGFFKNKFKMIGSMKGNAPTPWDLNAEYKDRFGDLVLGQKVAVRVTAVNNTTGQAGTPVVASAIIVA